MPDRVVGRALSAVEQGEVVIVEPVTDIDEDYVVRESEPAPSWSVAWVFIILAFFAGLGIGVFL